jgi:hypothetical protein
MSLKNPVTPPGIDPGTSDLTTTPPQAYMNMYEVQSLINHAMCATSTSSEFLRNVSVASGLTCQLPTVANNEVNTS